MSHASRKELGGSLACAIYVIHVIYVKDIQPRERISGGAKEEVVTFFYYSYLGFATAKRSPSRQTLTSEIRGSTSNQRRRGADDRPSSTFFVMRRKVRISVYELGAATTDRTVAARCDHILSQLQSWLVTVAGLEVTLS